MRSIFVGIIILAASMAVVHPAQAQQHSQARGDFPPWAIDDFAECGNCSSRG
jgi:hypothetical protein